MIRIIIVGVLHSGVPRFLCLRGYQMYVFVYAMFCKYVSIIYIVCNMNALTIVLHWLFAFKHGKYIQ